MRAVYHSRDREREESEVEEGKMSSGNATSLTILMLHVSEWSSERPTQARSGVRMLTSPALGECDFVHACRDSDAFCEASSVDCIVESEGKDLDTMLERDASVPLRVLAKSAPEPGVISAADSIIDDESVEVGDRVGDTIRDVRRFGSEEYRSNPAEPKRLMTSCKRDSFT